MKTKAFSLVVCAGLGLGLGCGGDDSNTGGSGGSTATGDGSAGGFGGSGGGNPSVGGICEQGCVATLAADCANGPSSQSTCVNDCQSLMNGSCGALYRALQTCAEGKAITCSAQGQPVILACATEQDAFVSCLNTT